MPVFVQAINIPNAFTDKEQIQNVLRNVGRVNHVSFHKGGDDHHHNAVIHLEVGNTFKPITLSVHNGEKIQFQQLSDKFVKTMIGDDLQSHINTPFMNRIGVKIWNN